MQKTAFKSELLTKAFLHTEGCHASHVNHFCQVLTHFGFNALIILPIDAYVSRLKFPFVNFLLNLCYISMGLIDKETTMRKPLKKSRKACFSPFFFSMLKPLKTGRQPIIFCLPL